MGLYLSHINKNHVQNIELESRGRNSRWQLALGDQRWRERAQASERARWVGREKVAVWRTLAFTLGRAEEFCFSCAPSKTVPAVDPGVCPELPLLRLRPRAELAGLSQHGPGGKRAYLTYHSQSRSLSAHGYAGADHERPPGLVPQPLAPQDDPVFAQLKPVLGAANPARHAALFPGPDKV